MDTSCRENEGDTLPKQLISYKPNGKGWKTRIPGKDSLNSLTGTSGTPWKTGMRSRNA